MFGEEWSSVGDQSSISKRFREEFDTYWYSHEIRELEQLKKECKELSNETPGRFVDVDKLDDILKHEKEISVRRDKICTRISELSDWQQVHALRVMDTIPFDDRWILIPDKDSGDKIYVGKTGRTKVHTPFEYIRYLIICPMVRIYGYPYSPASYAAEEPGFPYASYHLVRIT